MILLSKKITKNASRKMTVATKPDAVIRCQDLSVTYGAKQALYPTTLSLGTGKIHVLVGQNGAGKTSLAHALSGIIRPNSGRFWIWGQEVRDSSVQVVRSLGLDMVHQRFTLPPNFTICEALELVSAKKQAAPVYSIRDLANAWGRSLQYAGMNMSPNARIRDLPIETLQSLEIVRALSGSANVLILDEPTALLSPVGVKNLFQRLRQLREAGVTLLLILHKLREVMDIADTVSVLRSGRLVLPPTAIGAVTTRDLSGLIIGDSRGDNRQAVAQDAVIGQASAEINLSLSEVATQRSETEPALAKISLAIAIGEILGIAGVEGNGQRSLVEVVTGQKPAQSGAVSLLGEDVTRQEHHRRRTIGLRVVPFDRESEGASLALPLWENISTWNAQKYRRSWLPWLNTNAMRRAAKFALDRFDVQYESLDQPAGSLSGGNMQRLILARELQDSPQVVIAAQPTRGLDFQATQFVWHVLNNLKRAGTSILLVSSDLDELFNLADRVLVIRGGQIVGEHSPVFDRQLIGADMIGAAQ